MLSEAASRRLTDARGDLDDGVVEGDDRAAARGRQFGDGCGCEVAVDVS